GSVLGTVPRHSLVAAHSPRQRRWCSSREYRVDHTTLAGCAVTATAPVKGEWRGTVPPPGGRREREERSARIACACHSADRRLPTWVRDLRVDMMNVNAPTRALRTPNGR